MLMADTMAIFFAILGMMFALPGLWLLCRGLWPSSVAEAAERCRKDLWLSFIVGLPITIVALFLGVRLLNAPGGLLKAAGVGLLCAFMVHAQTGVSGLATVIGGRLASPVDQNREWRATLRGGVVLELAFLLPILGWFLIFPVSVVIGSGALISTNFRRFRTTLKRIGKPPAAAAEDPSTEQVEGRIRESVGAVL